MLLAIAVSWLALRQQQCSEIVVNSAQRFTISKAKRKAENNDGDWHDLFVVEVGPEYAQLTSMLLFAQTRTQ